MSTLIEQLVSERIQGGRLVLAYAVGVIFGVALAAMALLATAS